MNHLYRQIRTMGTILDIVLPGADSDSVEQILEMVIHEVERIESRLSIFEPSSDLSRINSNAFEQIVETDEELNGIFSEIEDYNDLTEGYFDITLKPVQDFYRENGIATELPQTVKRSCGMELLEIGDHSIRFLEEGVFLDLGGYGKGYAVKRIIELLQLHSIDSALISFGGSLVTGMGSHPEGDSWKVSIPSDLQDKESKEVNIDLKNQSLSTSGNSLNNQKKFRNSGHIIDPVSKRVRTENSLVSVVSGDPVKAEVYSTAIFAAGKTRYKERLNGVEDLLVHWI